MEHKKAILVVSFGTSHHDTLEKNIARIEQEIRDAFPQWEVRRAFTSGMILRKLRSRDGMRIDTVAEALKQLAAEDFDTVVCQPTHILNGKEYDDIAEACGTFRGRFERFAIGAPLLTATADYRQSARVMAQLFPEEPDTALCLMGHGSEHFADCAYAALDYHFKDMGRNDIHVGTVEGYPDLETLLRHVKEFGAKKVVLTPLMVVAGEHAKNDMAGSGQDSWNSLFRAAGYTVRCVLKGLGEYHEIRRIYVTHTRAAIKSLEQ